jgi:hypothetical protein
VGPTNLTENKKNSTNSTNNAVLVGKKDRHTDNKRTSHIEKRTENKPKRY